jgi:hypothetical protein
VAGELPLSFLRRLLRLGLRCGCCLRLRRSLLNLLSFWWSQDQVKRVAFLTGPELHDRFIAKILNQPLQDLAPQSLTRHFASTEEYGGLDFIAFSKKPQNVVLLGLVIMFIHVDAEFHFLDGDDMLMFFCLAFPLLLLIHELAKVHDATDRGLCGGRNLYQIKVLFFGEFERFEGWQNTELISFVIDHAKFTCSNAIIGADKTLVDTVLQDTKLLINYTMQMRWLR